MPTMIALLLLLLPQLASAEPTLSEADVIRMAQRRSPGSAVASATESLAAARERTAGTLPNPRLSYERESIETGPGGAENTLSATVPIELTRPRAMRSASSAESAWVRTEAELTRNAAVLSAVLAYYDVAIAERSVAILSEAVSNLDEAARVLAQREAAGSASGYETTRLSIAGQLLRSRLAEASASVEQAKAMLARELGLEGRDLVVSSTVSLLPASEVGRLAERGGASRNVVRRARTAERLASKAERDAETAWFPNLELGAGVKHTTEDGGGYGYVLGVSVSLPFFDRGQALQAESGARRVWVNARARALERDIASELESALVVYRAAGQELARFEAGTTGHIKALLVAAQSGYREGERTIVELLDAQRAKTEVDERRLALLGLAKRAEVRLRAAAGALE